MALVELADYWMGRDATHPHDLSTDIRRNAARTVDLVNQLLNRLPDWVTLERHPVHNSLLSSGWRPPSVNANVKGAALRSKHITGHACDVYDPDGDIDEFLLSAAGQTLLAELGLWLEHPSATKGWCHLQTIPPRSGNRVFYP